MDNSLTKLIRAILFRYPDSRTSVKIAYQRFCEECAEDTALLATVNPGSFDRIWRRHRKSFGY